MDADLPPWCGRGESSASIGGRRRTSYARWASSPWASRRSPRPYQHHWFKCAGSGGGRCRSGGRLVGSRADDVRQYQTYSAPLAPFANLGWCRLHDHRWTLCKLASGRAQEKLRRTTRARGRNCRRQPYASSAATCGEESCPWWADSSASDGLYSYWLRQKVRRRGYLGKRKSTKRQFVSYLVAKKFGSAKCNNFNIFLK